MNAPPHLQLDCSCFSSFNAMFMTEPASGYGVEGLCGCVCVVLYTGFPCLFLWHEPEAGSSAEAYISSVKLSSEKSLMEPYVVYLLISFKEILSAPSVSLTKISLWWWSRRGRSRIFNSSSAQSVPKTGGFSRSFHHSPIEGIQLERWANCAL